MAFVAIFSQIKVLFGPLVIQLMWYILKQLFTSVSLKVVDIYLVALWLGQYPPLFTGFVRVRENLESPGILFWHFPGLESPGKRPLVLESSGNLLNSTKCSKRKLWNLFTVAIKPNYLEVYGRQ